MERVKEKIVISLVVVFALGLLFAKAWQYFQKRPWPPVLTTTTNAVESGDVIKLTWVPATNGPQPEFYYLEQSLNQSFPPQPPQIKIPHNPGKTQQEYQLIAPAISSSTTYHYRVLAGYISKYYKPNDILSNPSNVVTVSIKSIPAPSLLPITPATIFSGQDYTISWTSVAKANAYILEEKQPDSSTKEYKLSGTSKTFVAPPLQQDGTFTYRVKAANVTGSNWAYITEWSNQEIMTVKYVEAPLNLMVNPKVVQNPQQFKVSWDVPPSGPQPISSYKYRLRETEQAQLPNYLPFQSGTVYTATAPIVSSSTTITYEVEAYFGNNPMTFLSTSPVKVTVVPPPPPPPPPPLPPLPTINSVNPNVQAKGKTVVISGTNFDPICGKNVVTIGSVPVTPTACSGISLTIQVPPQAPYGSTTITVMTNSQKSNAFPLVVAREPGNFVEITKDIVGQTTNRICATGTVKIDVCPPNCPGYPSGAYVAFFRNTGNNALIGGSPFTFRKNNNQVAGIGGVGFSLCNVGIVLNGDATGYTSGLMSLFFLDLESGKKFNTSPYPFNWWTPDGPPYTTYMPRIFRSQDGTIILVVTAASLGPNKLTALFIDKVKSGDTISTVSTAQISQDSGAISAVITANNQIIFSFGTTMYPKISIP